MGDGEQTVRDRLEVVRGRIDAAGGNLDAVTVVVASKRQPISKILEALDAGITNFGENYFDELAEKAPVLSGLRP